MFSEKVDKDIAVDIFKDGWILSKKELKWLDKQPEYVRGDQTTRYRLEAIFYFCHRNKYSCKLIGDRVFITTSNDEWLFDYTCQAIRLNHVNKSGSSFHFQVEYTGIKSLLYYIRRHDGSLFRRIKNDHITDFSWYLPRRKGLNRWARKEENRRD